MNGTIAVALCVGRLKALENEVGNLQRKLDKEEKWRRRIEKFLQSQFGEGYDVGATNEEGEEPEASESEDLNMKVQGSPKSSLLKRKFDQCSKDGSPNSGCDIELVDPESDDESDAHSIEYKTPRSIGNEEKLLRNSQVKAEPNQYENDLEIDIVWQNQKPEQIKVEPSISFIELDGPSPDEILDEWEIYNSDEEDSIMDGGDEDPSLSFETEVNSNGVTGALYDDEGDKQNQRGNLFEVGEEDSSIPFMSQLSELVSNQAQTTSASSLVSAATATRPSGPSRLILLKPVNSNNLHQYGQGLRKINISDLSSSGLQITQQNGLKLVDVRRPSASPDKKAECPKCGKLFYTPAEMMRHQRIHSGVKPFKCYICDYSTSFNGDLVRHLRCRHPGVEPYVCHVCPFKCQELQDFTDHRRRFGHGGRGAGAFKPLQQLNPVNCPEKSIPKTD